MARDKGKTRTALVDGAVEEFRERGFFGTDTNRLARRGGFAPQTFYRHFRDKLEIFLEVYRYWGELLWEGLREEFAAFGRLGKGASREDVRALAERVVGKVLASHREFYRIRGSLRALVVTEEEALAAQAIQRSRQLEGMAGLAEHPLFVARSTEESLSLLLEMERVCDAIACGELERIEGVDEAVMQEVLVDRMERFLCGPS